MTKFTLLRRHFRKDPSYAEFYKNFTNSLVANAETHTEGQKDGRGIHIMNSYFVKNAQNSHSCTDTVIVYATRIRKVSLIKL